jgi:hypothetical protein
MQVRSIEYEMAMSSYLRQQREMEAMLGRMIGQYGVPKMSLGELRRELESRLEGVSASQMIIEAR